MNRPLDDRHENKQKYAHCTYSSEILNNGALIFEQEIIVFFNSTSVGGALQDLPNNRHNSLGQ
jgi:hypothetical protein